MDQVLSDIFSTQWHVLIIVAVLLMLAAEWGYRTGLRLHTGEGEESRGQIGAVQGAVLGLLGLLLGFTFAMAVQRYDLRRDLVVQEANSVGTTFLRASFLPEPYQTEVKQLLQRYVDFRLAFYQAGRSEQDVAAAERASAAVQQQLWAHATASARLTASPLIAIFVTSLNETIDLDATRLAALRNRVPPPVWLLLLLVAGCGAWSTGYASGATGKRLWFSQLMLPLLIAVVITILVDLDSPRRGLVGVSQESLIDLKRSLGTSGP